ncbi:25S rRNA (adenine645-N1)-methyltransferase [Neocucurbitaria cava]|uniref:Ribosomal RNA-processing protein 8 n=1 Tax=Neocucurbitaria cava TaxID=798079 RepID=A0A9W8XYH8_9PLEO|nr:25S rRNA (adenine645-N1)-methyltransferase [Neocucurbitaria cava]
MSPTSRSVKPSAAQKFRDLDYTFAQLDLSPIHVLNSLTSDTTVASMFAVPGWNVSAPIKAQVEAPKPKDPNKLGKKALKRKEKQELQVNAENIGEYWDKVAAGKGVEAQGEEPVAQKAAEATGEDAPEKRGKKRKRGKAGGNKDKKESEDGASKVDAVAQDVSAEKPSAATDGDSMRDKKKRKKEQKAANQQVEANGVQAPEISQPLAPLSLIPEPKGLTPLQKSMRSKLASARFRHLNESLYTKPSAESLDLFKEDPSMFEDYHRGFAQQVEVWPENPVDSYVQSILSRGKIRNKDPWKDKKRQAKKGKGGAPEVEQPDSAVAPARGDAKPLPRNIKGHATIADLGCGTASLSYHLQSQLKPLNLTFHSFDLSKPSGPSASLVTVADISALPLPDNSVDVAIFCLALMGTNWLDFIDEAYRILRWRGELWVSEIKSRFGRVDRKTGKAPINSIGSLRKQLPDGKKGGGGGKKGKGADKGGEGEEGIAGSDDEAELAVNVDGADAKEGTDVSAFVEVLRKRGFVLDALPERPNDAIDLSNKMFVKMQFVKAAHPSRGKNAKEDQKAGAGRPSAVGGGAGALKMGIKGKKFGIVKEADDERGSEEKDKAVLKPCLYKIR